MKPSKAPKKPKKSILNPKFDFSSSEEEDDTEDEHTEKGTNEPVVVRRSARKTLSVDQKKKLQIIRPKDNLKERFGLSSKEAQELLLLLQSDERYDEEIIPFATESGAYLDQVKEVIIPNVLPKKSTKTVRSKNNSSSSSKASFRSILTSEQVARNRLGSNYEEYDLDSDDESFLQTLNKKSRSHLEPKRGKNVSLKESKPTAQLAPLSDSCLEIMISFLERELEASKANLKRNLEFEIPFILTQKFLSIGQETLQLLSAALTGGPQKAAKGNPRKGASKKKSNPIKEQQPPSLSEILSLYQKKLDTSTSLLFVFYQLLHPSSTPSTYSSSSLLPDYQSPLGFHFPLPVLSHFISTIYLDCLSDDSPDFTRRGRPPKLKSSPQGAVSLTPLLNGKRFTRRVYEVEFIESLLSEDSGIALLHSIFDSPSPLSCPAPLPRPFNELDLTSSQVEFYRTIYRYWVEKRSQHLDSLLRSSHHLSDDHWSLGMLNLLTITENNSFESFMTTHQRQSLYQLKHYFDQIQETLRKISCGERVKKEFLQNAKKELEKLLVELLEEHSRSLRRFQGGNETVGRDMKGKDSNDSAPLKKKRGRPRLTPPQPSPSPLVISAAVPFIRGRNFKEETGESSLRSSNGCCDPKYSLSVQSCADREPTVTRVSKKRGKENVPRTIDHTNKRKRCDQGDPSEQAIHAADSAVVKDLEEKQPTKRALRSLRVNDDQSVPPPPPPLPGSPFQARLRSALCSLSHLGNYVYKSLGGGS
jgi:hypothetical protein